MIAVIATIASATPLRAQDESRRFDAGSFTVELPAGVPRLTLVDSSVVVGFHIEAFTGGHPQRLAVIIYHSWHPGTEESYRAFAQAVNASVRDLRQTFNDSSLTMRRTLLRGRRDGFSNTTGWMFLAEEAREIRSDGRLTLRSPVTMRKEGQPAMAGWADASVVMRPGLDSWTVMLVGPARTPELDAAAVRMLDSFRITGQRTSLPLAGQPR